MLAARLVLAAVFTVAALGKLFDLAGSRQAMRDFGIPPAAAKVTGTLLPIAELAVGGALILPVSARVGGFAALVLLLAFVAGILNALSRGLAPDCHCFGAVHSAKAGRGAIVRNLLLAAIAGVVVAAPGPRIAGQAHAFSESVVAWLALVAATGALVATAALRRRRGGSHPSSGEHVPPDGGSVPIGALAPAFSGDGSNGVGAVSLTTLRLGGVPMLVVFSSRNCGPCQALAPDVARWRRDLTGVVRIVVVEDDASTNERYGVSGTPAAVLVDADGRIGSTLALGGTSIAQLIGSLDPTATDEPESWVSGFTRRQVLASAAAAAASLLAARPVPAFGLSRSSKKCHGVHCGSTCCPKGEVCKKVRKHGKTHHVCHCPSGKVHCHGKCVAMATDENNCGKCGHKCAKGEVCKHGKCTLVCPKGQVACGNKCVDLESNKEHCGACGTSCPAGQTCVKGKCVAVCPNGNSDCPAGQICDNGVCAPP